MAHSLINRYTYGNSDWSSISSLEAEIVYESPRREREIISLAKRQLEAQHNISREIVRSNIAGAQIISAEIAQQSAVLNSNIHRIGNQISEEISDAADQISNIIEIVGDHICVELVEIRWELSQQNKIMEEILEVLHQNRNNEARQLVRQGVRHYVNEEYEEAEERFREALKSDTTDYQVLMNIGYIEIHKDNASNAHTFFRKALSLPDNLDSTSKSRTLWTIGRLYYTERDYDRAFSFADQALKENEWRDPKWIFASGVYAALAGKNSVATERIKSAIIRNPALFVTASVEPDLKIIQQDILALLSQLSQEALGKAKQEIGEVHKALSDIEAKEQHPEYSSIVNSLQGHLKKSYEVLERPSYSDCLKCQTNIGTLKEPSLQISQIILLCRKKHELEKKLKNEEEEHEELKSKITTKPLGTDNSFLFGCLAYPLMYILADYFLMEAACSDKFDSPLSGTLLERLIMGLIWPVYFVISLLPALFGDNRFRVMIGGALKGLFLGGLISAIVAGITIFIEKITEVNYDKTSSRASKKESEVSVTKETLNEVMVKINGYRENIKKKISGLMW
ncbi:MAG: hypothetical protein V2A53_07395 [bacterium]